MRIIESYLNDYKRSVIAERRSFAKIMFKYIIGSCLKKMSLRAFNWASLFMIRSLEWNTDWRITPVFSPVTISPDCKLSAFLNTPTEDKLGPNIQTFGQWVMSHHPFKNPSSKSLHDFLTAALGPSDYEFNWDIASTFHDLLLSSLYAYLFTMKQLQTDIQNVGFAGQFSNAVRILYVVTYSNAMRAYFAHAKVPLTYPMQGSSKTYVNDVKNKISHWQKWKLEGKRWEDRFGVGADDDGNAESSHPDGTSAEGPRFGDKGVEGSHCNNEDDETLKDDYVDQFKDSDVYSIYRRSFMSFVDHIAGLQLLERRSCRLPADERIKLSLIGIKPITTQYHATWKEMETVIHDTCKNFKSNLFKPEAQNVIDTIKERLKRDSNSSNKAIILFKKLLIIDERPGSSRLRVNGNIHCESSLAAIICWLHCHRDNILDQGSDSSWRCQQDLFEACPSSHSSSFTLDL